MAGRQEHRTRGVATCARAALLPLGPMAWPPAEASGPIDFRYDAPCRRLPARRDGAGPTAAQARQASAAEAQVLRARASTGRARASEAAGGTRRRWGGRGGTPMAAPADMVSDARVTPQPLLSSAPAAACGI